MSADYFGFFLICLLFLVFMFVVLMCVGAFVLITDSIFRLVFRRIRARLLKEYIDGQ